jgi:hypothetical protein
MSAIDCCSSCHLCSVAISASTFFYEARVSVRSSFGQGLYRLGKADFCSWLWLTLAADLYILASISNTLWLQFNSLLQHRIISLQLDVA